MLYWVTSTAGGSSFLILGFIFLYMWLALQLQKSAFEQKKQPTVAILMGAPQINGEEAILSVWLPALQKPNRQQDTYQCYIPAAYVQYLQQQIPVFYTKSRLLFGIPTLRIEVQGVPAPKRNTRNTARYFCLAVGIILTLIGVIMLISK